MLNSMKTKIQDVRKERAMKRLARDAKRILALFGDAEK